MGIARWYFYGTKSWSDQEARRSIDRGRGHSVLARQIDASERRASARKARRATRGRKK